MSTLNYVSLKGSDVLDLASLTAAATTMNVPIPRGSTPGAADSADRLFFYIVNADSADKTFTVKAGTGTAPSTRGGTGDLAVTISHTAGGGIVGPIETNRFAQSDGSINLTFSATTSVTIGAYMLPARW
jgi:hypothetical protein